MYFVVAAEGHIRRYSYDVDGGNLIASLPSNAAWLPDGADGSAIDRDGYLWNARYGGGCVMRLSPTGEVVEVVKLPASQPVACTFGGERLDILYVMTARQRLGAEAMLDQPLRHVFKLAVKHRDFMNLPFLCREGGRVRPHAWHW